jgi:hypothetical protein
VDPNLERFKGRLPYASEVFGIFQPLLGWKSRLIQNRLFAGLQLPDFPRVVGVDAPPNTDHILVRFAPESQFEIVDGAILPPENVLRMFEDRPELLEFHVPPYLDSLLVRTLQERVRENLPAHPPSDHSFWGPFWTDQLSKPSLDKTLTKAVKDMAGKPVFRLLINEGDLTPQLEYAQVTRLGLGDMGSAVDYIFNREVYVAQYLNSLLPAAGQDAAAIGFPANVNQLLLDVIPPLELRKVLEMLDPLNLAKGAGRDAVLSPIGIVHLFRQFFFEFENFLGPPVEHIWLSPGSTTELIEVSTRRVLQEYTLEKLAETLERSEISTTTQDELSEAIKEENTRNTKLGSSLSGGATILIAHVEASGSMSVEETAKRAREENHKTSRQQSAKLSSEIRSNVKSTFRTVTEVTDVRSKRYTIVNSTPNLVNYELRRKMRQVGVQQQDLGTQLCWQVYIDDPGADLGVSQLVHLASKADLSQFAHVPRKPIPSAVVQTVTILLPVPNPGDRSRLGPIAAAATAGFIIGSIPGAVVGVAVDEVLNDLFGGKEKSKSYDIGTQETIHQPYKINLPQGYQIVDKNQQIDDEVFKKGVDGDIPVRKIGANGANLNFRMNIMNAAEGVMDLVVFGGSVTPGEICTFQALIKVAPTGEQVEAIKKENAAIDEENERKDIERERRIREEFIKNVRERVELASRIKARPTDDLREEERTIVYRRLIHRLMREAWVIAGDRNLAHLRSELIKSLFDVDKMLYFVAPEWWQPRRHSRLDIGADTPTYSEALDISNMVNSATQAALTAQSALVTTLGRKAARHKLGTLGTEDLVGWGGEGREDNYLITDNSVAARLGSSLGWLIQLDGDNLRNAFLNAPWVKAVVPIRPGREKEALEWLKQSQVEGTEGLDSLYVGDDLSLLKAKYIARHGVDKALTIGDVIDLIAEDVKIKFDTASEVVKEQVAVGPGQNSDIYYLRPDHVFEKGFDPLKGGFRALPLTVDGKPQFEIFDQWIEIVPTDQIAAVAVEYDPQTGFLK